MGKIKSLDPENEVRRLLNVYGDEILVLSPDRHKDRMNPWEPPLPDMSFGDWLPHPTEVFCRNFFIKDAGYAEMMEAGVKSYKQLGEETTIHLGHIKEYLESKRDYFNSQKKSTFREREWLVSPINRIGNVLQEQGPTFLCNRGYSFSKIQSRHVIFELFHMSNAMREFYRDIVILKLYYAQALHPNPPDQFLFIDEALRVLPASLDYSSDDEDLPIVSVIIVQGTKRRIFVIPASQVPSMVSKLMKSAGTVVSFALNTETEQRELFASLMLMSREQQAELGKLERRQAIICRHGIMSNPVRFQVLHHDYPLKTDAEVDEIQRPQWEYLSEDVVVDNRTVRYIPPTLKVLKKPKEGSEGADPKPPLFEDLMENIRDSPLLSQKERADELDVTDTSISNGVAKAIEDGFAKEISVPVGPGRPIKLLQFTDEGNAKFGQQKTGKGKLEHFFWINRGESHFSSPENRIQSEWADLDLVVFKGQEKHVCVQVDLHKNYDHILSNISKGFQHGFPTVLSGLPTKEVVKAVEKRAKKHFQETELERIQFVVLYEFFKEEE
jgi:hypothetical protein